MTHFFDDSKITVNDTRDRQPGVRRSLQYLFNDIFVRAPAAPPITAAICTPFSNDTPPPSGETMREPPVGNTPKKPGLHLPPCPRIESDTTATASGSGSVLSK